MEERFSASAATESVPTASSATTADSAGQARNPGLRRLAVWIQRSAWVVFGLVNIATLSGLLLLWGERRYYNLPYFSALQFLQFLSVMGSFATGLVVWMLMMAVGGMIPVVLDIEEHAREISNRVS